MSFALTCNQVTYGYGSKEILTDISFSIDVGSVVALVGKNGVGKSTLLSLVAGISKPDSGSLQLSPDTAVVYIPQVVLPQERHILVSEYLTRIPRGFHHLLKMPPDTLERSIDSLSGGQQARLRLALLLSTRANLYLLDEPTNNLDEDGLSILEHFLSEKGNRSTIIMVSHDRALLEKYAHVVMEIGDEGTSVTEYKGSYSDYVQKKKADVASKWKLYDDYILQKRTLETSLQEKRRWFGLNETRDSSTDNDKMQSGTFRNWSSKRLGQGIRSAEKKVQTLEAIDRPEEPRPVHYKINPHERGSDTVFSVSDVVKKFDRCTIGPFNTEIGYGERIAIVGENGSGKTTLIRLLMGEITPDSGTIKKGANVTIGYVPQFTSDDVLELRKQIETHDHDTQNLFRTTLGGLGINPRHLTNDRSLLSPGERLKFYIAYLLTIGPNCLILDEPTNHLDVLACDFLEETLKSYEGTLIVISHDRYFRKQIGIEREISLDNGKLP
jgi:ATPase subunit of ABC transporter with duplicated ATPase domains